MSELQLIIGLLSTKPQICLHFDHFLFKHTSKPHICLHFDHFLSQPTQNLSSFPPVSIEGMWSSNEYGRSMSPDINMCPPHCPWCHTQGPKVYLVLLDAQTAKEAMCRKSFRSLGLFLTLSQSVNWFGSRRWHEHQHVSCITLPLMSHLGSKGVFDAPVCTNS